MGRRHAAVRAVADASLHRRCEAKLPPSSTLSSPDSTCALPCTGSLRRDSVLSTIPGMGQGERGVSSRLRVELQGPGDCRSGGGRCRAKRGGGAGSLYSGRLGGLPVGASEPRQLLLLAADG